MIFPSIVYTPLKTGFRRVTMSYAASVFSVKKWLSGFCPQCNEFYTAVRNAIGVISWGDIEDSRPAETFDQFLEVNMHLSQVYEEIGDGE